MAGKVVIDAGQEFDATSEEAGQRLIDAGFAERVDTKPSDTKETTKSKPAANRETRGGSKD